MQTQKHVLLKKNEASERQRASSLASQFLDHKFFLRVKCPCALVSVINFCVLITFLPPFLFFSPPSLFSLLFPFEFYGLTTPGKLRI